MPMQIIEPELMPHVNDPPPHDLETEREFLRRMIEFPKNIGALGSASAGAVFYDPRHRMLFELILDHQERGEPVNRARVEDWLKLQNKGDAGYLTQLIAAACGEDEAKECDAILSNLFLRRQIISASNQVILRASQSNEDPRLTADWADKVFADLAGRDIESHLGQIDCDNIEDSIQHHAESCGVGTGLTELDKLLVGAGPASVTIVAGGVSVGKTALALAVLRHLAIDQKAAVCICSPGSSRQKIRERLLLARLPVSSSIPQAGQLSAADRELLADAERGLMNTPIWVDDSPRLTTVSLRMAGRRAKLERDIRCLIVDDLHLLYDPHGGDRHEHWCNVSRMLRVTAQELQLPLVAFVGLNPEPDLPNSCRRGRGIDALGGFGPLAQDADRILLVDRHAPRDPDITTDRPPNKVDVAVAKNRYGPTGMVRLALDPYTGALADWDTRGG